MKKRGNYNKPNPLKSRVGVRLPVNVYHGVSKYCNDNNVTVSEAVRRLTTTGLITEGYDVR